MNKLTTLAAISGLSIILAFAVTINATENQATAQTFPFPSREKVISVTGTATASVEPDLLVISFGVETQEKTAKQALDSNSELMTAVVESIKNVGIAEDELSTSRFNIQPIYDSYQDQVTKRYTQELIGYRVTNTITVETSQLNAAADIIDNGVLAGANRVDNVFFTLAPETQISIKDGLIEDAVLNAKSKAEKALVPLNHQIIGVKQISLSEFGIPPPIIQSFGFDEMAREGSVMKASTPVFTSDQDVTTTASVIFLIGSN